MQVPRVYPAAYLVGSIVVMGCLDRFIPLIDWISWPWNFAGLVPLSFGGVLIALSLAVLWRHETSVEPFQLPATLVTSGPFRFSRNPMYLGATFVLFGVAIVLGSATPFLVVPLFVSVIQLRVIALEESAMMHHFGEEYILYLSSVRRWW